MKEGKRERGRGDEKESGEKRDLKRYAEYRLWWMPQPVATMFSLHWSALLRNIPPRIPLADFPTPRQTAIEPLYTLVCASEEYILQTGGGARTGECNIDNNYGTTNVCRITNRTRFWWTSCARYRTRWFTIKEFLFIVFSLKIFLRLNSDTRFLRSFLKSATIDLKLRLKL